MSVKLSAKVSVMNEWSSASLPPARRRARQPDSLAAAVIEILVGLHCPLATPAMRIILTDRGRPTKAEQLSRLAAYQREDLARTLIAPPLCWTVEPDGRATTPRWWALSEWRYARRIRTEDTNRLWLAHLAERLAVDLAQKPDGRTDDIRNLALSSAASVLGPLTIETPSTGAPWAALRSAVHARFIGAFSNLTGITRLQDEAEQRLTPLTSGADRFFGTGSPV